MATKWPVREESVILQAARPLPDHQLVDRSILLADAGAASVLPLELEDLGFAVARARMGPDAINCAIDAHPDMVVVDCRGNKAAGLQMCRSFRSIEEVASIPLTLLAAATDGDWRSEAVECGADVWVAEAEALLTFLRHFKAVETRLDEGRRDGILRYADVQLDLKRFKVHRSGRLVPLTTMQMRLLKHFLEHPTIVFSRKDLLKAVWGNDALDEGAVTACVARVRRALNAAGQPNLIRSVLKEGYALVDSAEAGTA